MISQLDRTLDSNLLHVELYSRPFKKSFLNESVDGVQNTDGGVLKERGKGFTHQQHHHHTQNTFQIGNEDAGYQPSRAALRQFAQTQNDTSFHIGDEGCGDDHEVAINESKATSTTAKTIVPNAQSNRKTESPIRRKTSKRCFPRKSTVHNPPFGIQQDLLCESSNSQANQQNMDLNQSRETVAGRDAHVEVDVDSLECYNKTDSISDDQNNFHMILNNREILIDKENQRPEETDSITVCQELGTKDPKAHLEDQQPTFVGDNAVNPTENLKSHLEEQRTVVDINAVKPTTMKIGEDGNKVESTSITCNNPSFRVHKTSARNIVSAQKLGFAAPSGDYNEGIIRNKVQFKERLQEIKQSLKRSNHQDHHDHQSPSTIDEYPLHPTQYPCPGLPLTNNDFIDGVARINEDDGPAIIKKPDPKELHRQVYYQSVLDAEKSMQEKLQNDRQNAIERGGLTILDSSVVSPLPPKQLHKLTYESADRQQQQRQQQRAAAEQWATVQKMAESRARRKHFHTQSRLVYGSDSIGACTTPPTLPPPSSPQFVIKRSEPVALSLGYRLCGIDDAVVDKAVLSPPAFSSEVTPQNSSEMLLDGMLDQMSFEDDSMAVDVGSDCCTEVNEVY